jgi:hypothetical protein
LISFFILLPISATEQVNVSVKPWTCIL